MRILVCDDDAHLRAVIRAVATDRGHDVVGEVDTASDAYAFLARAKPDVAIVDLALRVGSGREVARDASARGCRVIVFSAYLDEIDPRSMGVVGVLKPDFAGLESALDALASTTHDSEQWRAGQADRRATVAAAERPRPTGAVEEATDFFKALSEARGGDTLVVIDVESTSPDDVSAFAVTVRAVIRAHDHIMRRGEQLTLLLVDGLPDAADAVLARLQRALAGGASAPTWTMRHALLTDDELSGDTYQRLRSPREDDLTTGGLPPS